MEYRVVKNQLPVYYSTMSGATRSPWQVIYGDNIGSAPLDKLHYHSVPEIGVCVSGSGDYHIGDKIYRYKAGDIQIIPPFIPHYARSDDGTVTKMVFFIFDIAKLMQLAGMLDPEKAMLMKEIEICIDGIFERDEYPELAYLIDKIIERAKTNDDYTDISVAFNIGEFLICCQKYKNESYLKAPNEFRKDEYKRIEPAINCITLSLSESSMLAEENLASLCDMSVSNFRRLFVAETGMSPKAFIIKSRMSYAEYLLKNTNMTILAVSERVGYNGISGFNKAFTETFNMSPNQYRMKYK